MPAKRRRTASPLETSTNGATGPLYTPGSSTAAASARSPAFLNREIKGICIPIRGVPGGLRLPPVTVLQLGYLLLGVAVGGSAVYTATHDEQPVKKQEKKRWLPKLLSSGPLAKDALAYGSPGSLHDVLLREAYVAAYDRSKRHPAWTAEHLTRDNLKSSTPSTPSLPPSPVAGPSSPPQLSSQESKSVVQGGSITSPTPSAAPPSKDGLVVVGQRAPPTPGSPDRQNSEFKEDDEVPELFRAKLADYVGSGYDRGHMVAAADARRSQQAMNETFKLSNIAPQVGEGFNRHYWAWLESFCRNLTKSFDDVYVFTVPLYLPKLDVQTKKWRVSYEVIGPPGLAPSISVPTHFAKVVLTRKESGDAALGAFVLPNTKIADMTPLESFVVPVDSVERAAGFVFFSDTVKENAVPLCQATKCDVVRRFFSETGEISVLEAPAVKAGEGKKET